MSHSNEEIVNSKIVNQSVNPSTNQNENLDLNESVHRNENCITRSGRISKTPLYLKDCIH